LTYLTSIEESMKDNTGFVESNILGPEGAALNSRGGPKGTHGKVFIRDKHPEGVPQKGKFDLFGINITDYF